MFLTGHEAFDFENIIPEQVAGLLRDRLSPDARRFRVRGRAFERFDQR
jgi:hypothetical protein